MPTRPTYRHLLVSVAVIATVAVQYVLKYFWAYAVFGPQQYNALPRWQHTLLVQGVGLVLCFATVGILCNFSISKAKEMMGLHRPIGKPLLYALIAALPMLVGLAVLSGFRVQSSFALIGWGSLWAGLNEELAFRAFIVGILVRYAGWHFIVAALLSGFLFASGHLYQAGSFPEAVGIFFFTSGVGIGFSVFYKYWEWNIWFPMFLHILMNLAFMLFAPHGNALMSGTENIFRFTTIAIAIGLTIYQKVQATRGASS